MTVVLRPLILIVILFAAAPALASLAPAPSLLASWVKQYLKRGPISITFKTTIHDGRTGAEQVYIAGPSLLRSRLTVSGLEQITVHNGPLQAVIVNGLIVDRPVGPITAYGLPFTWQTKEQAVEGLKRLKIKPLTLGMTLADPNLALIIGATSTDNSAPQVWIDKERHVPLKLVTPTISPQFALSVTYLGYNQSAGFWFPKKIVIRLGKHVIRTMEVVSVAQVTSVPDHLFDVRTIAKALSRVSNTDRRVSGQADDLGRIINRIRKSIRNLGRR